MCAVCFIFGLITLFLYYKYNREKSSVRLREMCKEISKTV